MDNNTQPITVPDTRDMVDTLDMEDKHMEAILLHKLITQSHMPQNQPLANTLNIDQLKNPTLIMSQKPLTDQ